MFGCESDSVTDRVNVEETNDEWSQSYKTNAIGQRDALPWSDVTLSTSYNKCHEWTSRGTSPINKCTGRRKYAFPDPCLLDFFFPCFGGYYHLSKYLTLIFNTLYMVFILLLHSLLYSDAIVV